MKKEQEKKEALEETEHPVELDPMLDRVELARAKSFLLAYFGISEAELPPLTRRGNWFILDTQLLPEDKKQFAFGHYADPVKGGRTMPAHIGNFKNEEGRLALGFSDSVCREDDSILEPFRGEEWYFFGEDEAIMFNYNDNGSENHRYDFKLCMVDFDYRHTSLKEELSQFDKR